MTPSMNLVGMTTSQIMEWISGFGEKPYRAQQLADWIYKKRATDFSVMTNIRKELRAELALHAEIRYPRIIEERHSQLDHTIKLLLGLGDGELIETVIMQDNERNTICISSQVGCSLGCSFCATGELGFRRNLNCGEILSQVLLAQNYLTHQKKRLNIVLMGMGEPLLNLDQVIPALRLLTLDEGLGLGKKRITLSTAGIPAGIRELADADLGVKLALSLNASDNIKRMALMPVNRRYPLEDVLEGLHYYQLNNRHRITFEYILIPGINNHPGDAEATLRLLRRFSYKINLIPYNPSVSLPYRSPTEDEIVSFSRLLMRGHGAVTIRRSRGADIMAACGQLKARYEKEG